MKILVYSLLFCLASSSMSAQGAGEILVAEKAVAAVRPTMPAGRLAIVNDTTMKVNSVLARTLGLPMTGRAQLYVCDTKDHCKIFGGGSALDVASVSITGDSAAVHVRTWTTESGYPHVIYVRYLVSLTRSGPTSPWVVASSRVFSRS